MACGATASATAHVWGRDPSLARGRGRKPTKQRHRSDPWRVQRSPPLPFALAVYALLYAALGVGRLQPAPPATVIYSIPRRSSRSFPGRWGMKLLERLAMSASRRSKAALARRHPLANRGYSRDGQVGHAANHLRPALCL
jgi:hypothetical protein